MNQEQFDDIKQRASRATKGPWVDIDSQFVLEPNGDGICQTFDCDTGLNYLDYKNNLNFIAHARTDIPVLIAEIERLRLYTDPKLFAAASNVVDAWDDYSQTNMASFIEAMDESLAANLSEAVAWWDSLPFDPAADTEKLPKYEE